MKLLDAVTASSTTGVWKEVPPGLWTITVEITGTGTVTLQGAKSATPNTTTGTSLGNLKDDTGAAYSFTASSVMQYGHVFGRCFVRASTTGVSGGSVTVWLDPADIETGKTGFEE